MGWISDRRMRTGKGIGGYVEHGKGSAPLKKIIHVIRFTDNLFSQNLVALECGHEVYSNGKYKARCIKCKDFNPTLAQTT